MSLIGTREFLKLISVAEQTGFNLTFSEPTKAGFVTSRPIIMCANSKVLASSYRMKWLSSDDAAHITEESLY